MKRLTENVIYKNSGLKKPLYTMPNYKISAFQDEDSERFQSFYDMSEALKNAVLLSHRWSEAGIDALLLKNIIESVRKTTPAGPFKHEVTSQYVESMLNICNACQNLADLLTLDQSLNVEKMDDATLAVQAQVAEICAENNELLRQYYIQHDRHNLTSGQSHEPNGHDAESPSRPRN